MAFITIKFDQGQINGIRRLLKAVPEKMPVIMTRGINRTLVSLRAETVRRMRPVLPVRQSSLLKRIKIYKATYKNLRGKVWIGGKDMPLSMFKARQTTRTRIAITTPAQAMWLYYNVFQKKLYGQAAKFSWHYKIKRRIPRVTYDLGKGRQTLEPAWIVTIRNFDHVMTKKGNTAPGLIVNNYGMVFVNNEKLLNQAAGVFTSLEIFAGRLLLKNVEDQVNLALAG